MSATSATWVQQTLLPSMSSAADFRVRTFPWLDAVLDWLEAAAVSGSSSPELLPHKCPALFSSRTSLAFCRPTKEGTWEPSSGRWGNSAMGGPTVSLTLNISESPSDGGVCSLSDVLETCDVPQKYFLSPKACRGILRRAEKRGKKLPPALEGALKAVAMRAEIKSP